MKYTLFGFYNWFIFGNLSEPFRSKKFAKSYYEARGLPEKFEEIPRCVFTLDSKVRAKMFGYAGGHTMYRYNSR